VAYLGRKAGQPADVTLALPASFRRRLVAATSYLLDEEAPEQSIVEE
jgi:hypothetical protein